MGCVRQVQTGVLCWSRQGRCGPGAFCERWRQQGALGSGISKAPPSVPFKAVSIFVHLVLGFGRLATHFLLQFFQEKT